jgi:hypothetical protein
MRPQLSHQAKSGFEFSFALQLSERFSTYARLFGMRT